MRLSREQALKEVYDEAKHLGVEIITDANPEIAEYMDHAAKRQGISPESLHAVTLGADTILIRERYASNIRVLREELIHTRQQIRSPLIDAGQNIITAMELDA